MHLGEEYPDHSNLTKLYKVIEIYIWYLYDVHIPLIMRGGVVRCHWTCRTHPYYDSVKDSYEEQEFWMTRLDWVGIRLNQFEMCEAHENCL